ncbi:MAG: HAD family hydrolase [Candidatus Nanohaloarchaeota archaeon QJJ-9]|nr:HAD family hydrolase [Candidatus Nanohaloarchaeota archaeon QJJ-9]
MILDKEGYLFDLDGTLVDTGRVEFKSFNSAVESRGMMSLEIGEFRNYFEKYQSFSKVLEAIGVEEKEEFIEEFHEKLVDKTAEYLDSGDIDTIPGALEFLREVDKLGKPMALLSNSPADAVDIKLECLGIRDCFDNIYTDRRIENKKPHPEGIKQFMDDYSLERPDVLFIGDSKQDIKTAENAGVEVMIVGGNRALDGVDYGFKNYEELLERIRSG